MNSKTRLDKFLTDLGLSETRSQARNWIKDGFVFVDDVQTKKAGTLVNNANTIEVKKNESFVSRGGDKISAAFTYFQLEVKGFNCIDVGASTGGFTDFLLQKEAEKIYAIDVGHSQLKENLRNNPRVINKEKTDIREENIIPELCDFAVIDVSFISLKKVLSPTFNFLKPNSKALCLFKPQFEGSPEMLNGRGVVKEASRREKILRNFNNWCKTQGFHIIDTFKSPLKGKKGNQEIFLFIEKMQ